LGGILVFKFYNFSKLVFRANGRVNIFDRHGDHKTEATIVLPGYALYHLNVETTFFFVYRTCTSLDWDIDGDLLSVANDKNGKSSQYEDQPSNLNF